MSIFFSPSKCNSNAVFDGQTIGWDTTSSSNGSGAGTRTTGRAITTGRVTITGRDTIISAAGSGSAAAARDQGPQSLFFICFSPSVS